MAKRARQAANVFRSNDFPDEGAYIDANWDTSIASPNAQYKRLQSEARWAIASAKDDPRFRTSRSRDVLHVQPRLLPLA